METSLSSYQSDEFAYAKYDENGMVLTEKVPTNQYDLHFRYQHDEIDEYDIFKIAQIQLKMDSDQAITIVLYSYVVKNVNRSIFPNWDIRCWISSNVHILKDVLEGKRGGKELSTAFNTAIAHKVF